MDQSSKYDQVIKSDAAARARRPQLHFLITACCAEGVTGRPKALRFTATEGVGCAGHPEAHWWLLAFIPLKIPVSKLASTWLSAKFGA